MITPGQLSQSLQRTIPAPDREATRELKDQRSQQRQFVAWLSSRGQPLDAQLLRDYHDHLQKERKFKASSIRSHLATLRTWLRGLLQNEDFRRDLQILLPSDLPSTERGLIVSNMLNQLWRAIDPHTIPVSLEEETVVLGFCPNSTQIQRLIDSLRIEPHMRLRDAAVIANMTFLGVRQIEVCALDVADVQGPRALRIPDKKGCTAREIPYAPFEIVAELNHLWISEARLTGGPLFRGFYRDYLRIRPERMSPRSVVRILDEYPIPVKGEGHILKPLELRRFAARLLAQQNLSLGEMYSRLGVTQAQTVLDYLGGNLPEPSHQQGSFDFQISHLHKSEPKRLWE